MKTKTKTIRTNSKAVKLAIRQHIQDSVTDGNGDTFPTFEAARAHLRAEFERVANYPNNLRRFPNNQARFHDYLMGIPFGFEFENYKIKEFLAGLGLPAPRRYDAEKSARLYAYLIYKELA
jgi:hypothetical protein